jgi:hypothetical protein
MIRISTVDDPTAITIVVDGLLSRDYIDAVETCIHQAAAQQRPIRLFLRNVCHIDEDARRLLSRLAAQGVELSASGIYSSYLVSEIQRKQARALGIVPVSERKEKL